MLTYRKPPFAHQEQDIVANSRKRHWGRFWEMGCAKTMPTIYEAALLYEAGEIDALVVVAPNGVHRLWVEDQLQEHMPLAVLENTRAFMWQSYKAATGRHKLEAEALVKHKGLSMLAITYDAIMTEAGRLYLKSFFRERSCMFVLDESPAIKNANAQRTKRIQAASHYAPYRRILTGTLVDDKPFDVYTQLRFLDQDCWKDLGIASPAAFRAFFGVWEKGYNGAQGREFQRLVTYRNLDVLHHKIKQYGSHHLKKDVLAHLPPKLYSKRYFELTAEQARIYKALCDEYQVTLNGGDMLTAPMAIVRLTRMRQLLSGYLPSDNDTTLRPIGPKNPRLDLLCEVVDETEGQSVIVWAVYQQDITSILEALHKQGVSAVRYDGRCSDAELFAAEDAFKSGKAQVFVANPAVGSQGLTLNIASTMIWYNNHFRLAFRKQGEDRNHRPGQKAQACNIIDLCAAGTVDDEIIHALRNKQEVVDCVLGTKQTEWV